MRFKCRFNAIPFRFGAEKVAHSQGIVQSVKKKHRRSCCEIQKMVDDRFLNLLALIIIIVGLIFQSNETHFKRTVNNGFKFHAGIFVSSGIPLLTGFTVYVSESQLFMLVAIFHPITPKIDYIEK